MLFIAWFVFTSRKHIMHHWWSIVYTDFSFQRRVRGILCDVWVAERGLRKGQYSTVEIYFSHENWTVEVEVFNKVHQVPIGISSYVAVAVSVQQFFETPTQMINENMKVVWGSIFKN